MADHPRAVSPVLLPFEGGRASEEVLVGSCVGVEYWVSANKHRWAGPGLKGYNKLLALVARIGGQAWSEIVGDVPRWADAVWGDYSSLKHNPSAPVDPKRVQVLGLSVRLALELALLRELAGNQQVTRRFQEAEALQGLRHGVEHVLN